MDRTMFVSLPVADLGRAVRFFGRLGLPFDPRLTDERAACLVVSERAYVVLLQEAFWRTFTDRDPCDAGRRGEALVALACASREEVDALAAAALAAGGAPARAPVDRGPVYERSFHDPDGHHWAAVWSDPRAVRGRRGARPPGVA